MPHVRWDAPLRTFLAEQPPETPSVALTLVDVETLVGGAVPPTGRTRGYWWDRGPRSMGQRLAVIGWRVTQVRVHPPTITFVRLPSDTTAQFPARQRP